ncbi:MAG: ABC transporter ATP-binding protein [Candidatus Margulisbacteria bacterium]|nr:ABC transporter ATP-binding protein [Candidatus Margulisiibacteriota bacterium]MBU1616829.1 ABC transporter ATP-binding protein [Candidatus Margulisiibacteriota bacterium]MBU1867241.1 ABC transporter ATP-binding protein [Candidatus Margulisiibacteriota bacterium]
MIKFNKLTKYFGKLKIIESSDLMIEDGSSVAIIGPSGCGKSTLLRLIIRLIEPTSGSIVVDGQDVGRLSEEALIELRKKIGMIFQTSALFDSMNVYENVAFALHQHTKKSEAQIRKIVAEKLKMVELDGVGELMPSELSGGMQRRVCIARALAFDPKIILYDEPTTGLDPITSVTIENLMVKLARELKATSILVTHVLQTVYRVANRVYMLNDGKLIDIGTTEETKNSKNPIVAKFISGGL